MKIDGWMREMAPPPMLLLATLERFRERMLLNAARDGLTSVLDIRTWAVRHG